MQTPIQVTFRGFEHSPVIDQLIQARAAQLQTLARDKLTSCHVVVERGHERAAIVFHARIDVTLPGTVLIVNHEPHNLHLIRMWTFRPYLRSPLMNLPFSDDCESSCVRWSQVSTGG